MSPFNGNRLAFSQVALVALIAFSYSQLGRAAEPSFVYKPSFGTEPSFDQEPQFGRSPDKRKPEKNAPVLPTLVLPDSARGSISGARLRVDSIVLRGNTVLPAEEVSSIVQPFLHRELSPEDLQAIRQQLTLLYINRGYLNSGVILPDQTVTDRQIHFQSLEGRLVDVQLKESGALSEDFVARQFSHRSAGPLSLADLETGIRRLELDPLVRRVEGRLMPGAVPGEALLDLKVEENHPLRIIAGFDNYVPPSVGSERGSLFIEHLNLTGGRDELRAVLSATEGLNDVFVSYRRPLWKDQLEIGVFYAQSNSDIVEQPLRSIDIDGDNKNAGLSLDYHLIDRMNRRVSILSTFNYARSETELLGERFSFSSGARDGLSVSTSIGLGFEWVERWGSQLLAVRSSVRQGLDFLGSTVIRSDEPSREFVTDARIAESKFTVFLSQVQWAKRLEFLNSEVVVNAAWQQSLDPLLSVDRFGIGGHDTVRGFRENSLLRDNGIYANFEWRVPVLRNSRWANWNFTATPFFDYGRSRDQDVRLSTNSPAIISSIGLGVSATPFAGARVVLSYGQRLKEEDIVSPQEHNLQDDGINFSFSYQWSPRR